ncbi:MAG: urease accessory protein UreE [Myxococcaceae bacterium]|nr:urease accessory protein UreE [Myxococcaceae bacterium]
MIEIRARTKEPLSLVDGPLKLTLVFQDRQRSRLRAVLSDGQPAALLLPRGTVLRGGDRLALSDGRVALVEAAPEAVSTVRADPSQADHVELLARAAYHLGNRHVPLQVGAKFLRYLRDHVLDAMVRDLGLSVSAEEAPFEPESGAYGKHTHPAGHHHHAHSHAHGQHAHDDAAQEPARVPGVTRGLGLVELRGAEHSGESSDLTDGARGR